MNYGRIIDGRFEPAPKCIKNDFNLTAEKYLAAGYMPVEEEPPNHQDGMEPVSREYVEGNGKIFSRWVYRAPVKATRIFSKLKTVEALIGLGVWPEVRAWIEAKGLYDLYLAAVEFSEDDARFLAGVDALKNKIGLSDEQVENILARCEK